MSNHKMAKTATIVRNGPAGTRFIYIDGELFPWYTQGGCTIEVVKGHFTELTLTLLIEDKVNVVAQDYTATSSVDAPLVYIDGGEYLDPITAVEGG